MSKYRKEDQNPAELPAKKMKKSLSIFVRPLPLPPAPDRTLLAPREVWFRSSERGPGVGSRESDGVCGSR